MSTKDKTKQICISCSFAGAKKCKHIKKFSGLKNNGKKIFLVFGKYRGVPIKEVPEDYIEWILSSNYFSRAAKEEIFYLYYR
jgi:hypothetical protein